MTSDEKNGDWVPPVDSGTSFTEEAVDIPELPSPLPSLEAFIRRELAKEKITFPLSSRLNTSEVSIEDKEEIDKVNQELQEGETDNIPLNDVPAMNQQDENNNGNTFQSDDSISISAKPKGSANSLAEEELSTTVRF